MRMHHTCHRDIVNCNGRMMAAHAQSMPVCFTIILSAACFQHIGAR